MDASLPYPLVSSCTTGMFVELCEAVLVARPAYSPQVREGSMSVAEWAQNKSLPWRRMLLDDGRVIAHVGVKADRDTGEVELCRLMVHPDYQRQGLARTMVDLTVAQFGTRLRALVGPDSPSHHLLRGLGWVEVGEACEPGESEPCLLMVCPHPHVPRIR